MQVVFMVVAAAVLVGLVLMIQLTVLVLVGLGTPSLELVTQREDMVI